jgi:hypothetical protein
MDILPSMGDLISFKDGIIGSINGFLGVFTEYQVPLIFIISMLIGFLLKKKYNESWVAGIIFGLLIFFAIRFTGIGG